MKYITSVSGRFWTILGNDWKTMEDDNPSDSVILFAICCGDQLSLRHHVIDWQQFWQFLLQRMWIKRQHATGFVMLSSSFMSCTMVMLQTWHSWSQIKESMQWKRYLILQSSQAIMISGCRYGSAITWTGRLAHRNWMRSQDSLTTIIRLMQWFNG